MASRSNAPDPMKVTFWIMMLLQRSNNKMPEESFSVVYLSFTRQEPGIPISDLLLMSFILNSPGTSILPSIKTVRLTVSRLLNAFFSSANVLTVTGFSPLPPSVTPSTEAQPTGCAHICIPRSTASAKMICLYIILISSFFI